MTPNRPMLYSFVMMLMALASPKRPKVIRHYETPRRLRGDTRAAFDARNVIVAVLGVMIVILIALNLTPTVADQVASLEGSANLSTDEQSLVGLTSLFRFITETEGDSREQARRIVTYLDEMEEERETEAEVRTPMTIQGEIRELYAAGKLSQNALAAKFDHLPRGCLCHL